MSFSALISPSPYDSPSYGSLVTDHESLTGTNITDKCYETYRRVKNRSGGDISASFSFTAPVEEGLLWFQNYVGWDFKEFHQNARVFRGYIDTIRLKIGNFMFTRSLSTMSNSVRIKYRTIAGNTYETDYQEDEASIGTYGRKQIILTAADFMSESTAIELAQRELANRRFPEVVLDDVGVIGGAFETPPNQAQLEVTVYGSANRLDWIVYENTGTVTVPVSLFVSDILTDIYSVNAIGVPGTPHDLIYPGRIETTAKEVVVTTNERPILQHILDLTKDLYWFVGCNASLRFDMFSTEDQQYRYVYHQNNQYGLELNGAVIPDAVISPYGTLTIPEFNLTARIDEVEYSPREGVRLRTDSDPETRRKAQASALSLSIQAQLNQWNQKQLAEAEKYSLGEI